MALIGATGQAKKRDVGESRGQEQARSPVKGCFLAFGRTLARFQITGLKAKAILFPSAAFCRLGRTAG